MIDTPSDALLEETDESLDVFHTSIFHQEWFLMHVDTSCAVLVLLFGRIHEFLTYILTDLQRNFERSSYYWTLVHHLSFPLIRILEGFEPLDRWPV